MFITFEGGEASGKSTQCKRLFTYLREKGCAVMHVREPGGNQQCEHIRNLLLHHRFEPLTEALLFNANRYELANNTIIPALAGGVVVLCDRYADSSMAYQGYGLGLDIAFLKVLESKAAIVKPDMTFLMDIDVKIAQERLKKRGLTNHIDERTDTFHERVRQGFLKIAAENPKRIVVLNAQEEEDSVFDKICEALKDVFKD